MAEYLSLSMKESITSVLIALLAVPFTLLFIIFLVLIALPLKLYCSLINYIAHLVDPDIEKMLTGLAAAQGRDFDDIYRKPSTTEVTCLCFNGVLNYAELRKQFERKVILRLDSTNAYPTLHYPEFQQYLTIFMGYLFLKKDRKFDLNNHFTFYNEHCRDKPVTHEDLIRIREECMTKPFLKNKSPWEFIVIDNYRPNPDEVEMWKMNTLAKGDDRYWAFLFRNHHALGDGFSTQSMLTFIADNPYQTTFPKKFTPWQKSMLNIRALTLGPYDLLKFFFSVDGYHALHRPFREHSGDYFIIQSKLFSIEKVKLLKDKFGVAFTTILVALISGGIRKFLVSNGKKVPGSMSVAIPFATEEHSDKFENDFSLTSINYAVHLADPKDRVEHANQQFKSLLSTSLIKMSDFMIDIYGCVPLRLFRWMSQKQIYSSTYSTMPGPTEVIRGYGSNLVEVNYSYGTSPDSTGFGISSITYNNNFRFILFIDTNVAGSRKAAEDIVKCITEEFDVLEKCHLAGEKFSGTLNGMVKSLPVEDDLRMKKWKESIKFD